MADQETPDQTRPLSPSKAPDPARSYERAKPEAESGMGRLDNNQAVPTDRPHEEAKTVPNRQGPRQINAEQSDDQRAAVRPGGAPTTRPADRRTEPDHSMLDEEPLSEDTMPTDIHDKRQRRHPRTEGRGGTP